MASWREFLDGEGYENLSKAKSLTDVSSKDDPDDDPFRSLYKAREHYKSVQKVLKKWADKRKVEDDLKFLSAALELRLGENYVSCEEKGSGEEHLQKCLDRIDDYKLTKEGAGIYQDVLNQLGILSAGRNKAEEAVEYFAQSEAVYHDFKSIVGGAPMCTDEFLEKPGPDINQLEGRRTKKLEDNYTHTLYYFAQVYQTLGDFETSATYCHITLQRQLDCNDYDSLEWALSCATLSQYYCAESDFSMSRHCLASADFIFEQAESDKESLTEEKKEKIAQGKADIQRCWVKYCLNLMECSRDELLIEASQIGEPQPDTDSQSSRAESTDVALPEMPQDTGSESSEPHVNESLDAKNVEQNTVDEQEQATKESNQDAEEKANSVPEVENEATEKSAEEAATGEEQTTLNQENQDTDDNTDQQKKKIVHQKPKLPEEPKFNLEVSSREEKITDKPFKTFDEARAVFLIVKKLIESSKEFYKFEEHCPDYISIVQDQSRSFKDLLFFELDMERQCKMHKRRIDMLTEVLKELSLQHYLLVCRQLMFEIAETYSAMMDLKIAIIEGVAGPGVRPTPHSVKKINTLAKESIKYYQEYLNTLKGGKPVYPNQFPENDERPGLIATFCMGRLHSKILTGDVQTRLLNMKKSKDCYQFLVDYCKRNPSAIRLVDAELDICKEMVLLLPKKMEKVRLESEI